MTHPQSQTDAAVLDPPEPPEDGGPESGSAQEASPSEPRLAAVPVPGSDGAPHDESPHDGSPQGARHDFAYAHIFQEMQEDRRNLRWAFWGAIVFHLVLFFVHLPTFVRPMEVTAAAKDKAYVIQQVRFRPPQAAPQREIPDEKRKKIPIPDPTPRDPEPIRELNVELPDLDYDLPVGELNLEIPDGPPGPPGPNLGDVVHVGGNVQAPLKLHAPRPGYTEEARQARLQGVVMLQVIVDTEGNVTRPVVLKGLPMGLADKAVETVLQWKFKPATRHGEPVPVYYNLTVNFSLQ